MSGTPLSPDELELAALLEEQDRRRKKVGHGWPGGLEALEQLEESERRELLARQLDEAHGAERRRRLVIARARGRRRE